MKAQQLKNSILQMAVQGKLVPQDPNDEPASVLLEHILANKEKLIKEGKIKKEKNPSIIFRGEDNLPYEKVGKNEPVCIADEVPFEIPDSWEWVRLADLVSIYTGKKDANFGNPQGKYDFFTCSNVPIRSASYSYDGEYLIMPGNGANIGLVIYYKGQFEAYQRTYLLENTNSINLHYLKYHLEYNWKQYNSDKMYGSAIPYIKLGNLQDYLVAFPPLEEQVRIVEEIDKLLPYVNQYDEKESQLSVLNSSFPELLRKSILQQAVMGKLVPQDPNDEPASVLLERICAEKDALIKSGKLKKDKHESIIYRRDNSHYEKVDGIERCVDDEIPFDIPESWMWCRLSALASFIGGYAYKSTSFVKHSDYQVLRLGNVKNDCLRLEQKPVYITKQQALLTSNFRCQKNDILLTMTGTRGKRDYFFTTRITTEQNIYINQRVGCLRPHIFCLSDWLIYSLKSECVLSQVFAHETGTANQGNLGAESILHTLIPLPPINEQKRIVSFLRQGFSGIDVLQMIS